MGGQRMADGRLSKSLVTTPQIHRVFVYGTLRRGQSNHSLIETSKFIAEAATLRTYWMSTTGVFPVVLDTVPADFGLPPLAVAGEVYHVDGAA
jgi:gamma-glutamylaminecyclotransferase